MVLLTDRLAYLLIYCGVCWFDRLQANSAKNDSYAARLAASGEFSLWHNLNHKSLLPGSQSLLTFLGDPQSSKYEGMSDADVQAALMKRIREQHPALASEIPEPSYFFISRHGYDPNTYGRNHDPPSPPSPFSFGLVYVSIVSALCIAQCSRPTVAVGNINIDRHPPGCWI